jgi:SAM-dependent methyltransferase
MSFFNDPGEARRYARHRPHFHPIAIGRALQALGITNPLSLALDVACGTGQSASGLLSIADHVLGLDVSWGMLAAADRDVSVKYVQSRAESLPLASGSVPFITCALAFHWFERGKFLAEAARVLQPGGILVVYNNGFKGIMLENPAFNSWGSEVYGVHYPSPPRDRRPITQVDAVRHGFDRLEEEVYDNEVEFTPEELADYLMTQTNVMSVVSQGQESLESVRGWLLDQLRPYFLADRGTFVFGTQAWYLVKANGG